MALRDKHYYDITQFKPIGWGYLLPAPNNGPYKQATPDSLYTALFHFLKKGTSYGVANSDEYDPKPLFAH